MSKPKDSDKIVDREFEDLKKSYEDKKEEFTKIVIKSLGGGEGNGILRGKDQENKFRNEIQTVQSILRRIDLDLKIQTKELFREGIDVMNKQIPVLKKILNSELYQQTIQQKQKEQPKQQPKVGRTRKNSDFVDGIGPSDIDIDIPPLPEELNQKISSKPDRPLPKIPTKQQPLPLPPKPTRPVPPAPTGTGIGTSDTTHAFKLEQKKQTEERKKPPTPPLTRQDKFKNPK